MRRTAVYLAFACSCLSGAVWAFPAPQGGGRSDCTGCHTLTRQEAAQLLRSLGVQVKEVKAAPIKGMFEVLAERDGKQGLIYIDFSKQYIMQGILALLTSTEPVATGPAAGEQQK